MPLTSRLGRLKASNRARNIRKMKTSYSFNIEWPTPNAFDGKILLGKPTGKRVRLSASSAMTK